MNRRLILFGKRPRPGRVKTRLVPPLTDAEALALYRAFLRDQLEFLRGFRDETRVEWCADGRPDAALDAGLPTAGIELTRQGAGDLGQRMQRAFERAFAEGAGAAVIIGADSPTLPAGRVRAAFAALEDQRAPVVAPAGDGGYVLIGLRAPQPALFEAVPWGGADVMAVTRSRAAAVGQALVELPPWYDVDDARGLARLRAELARPAGAARAPATAACLRGTVR